MRLKRKLRRLKRALKAKTKTVGVAILSRMPKSQKKRKRALITIIKSPRNKGSPEEIPNPNPGPASPKTQIFNKPTEAAQIKNDLLVSKNKFLEVKKMEEEKPKQNKQPIVETSVGLSKDGRFVIHKTTITDIKPASYYEKVLEER